MLKLLLPDNDINSKLMIPKKELYKEKLMRIVVGLWEKVVSYSLGIPLLGEKNAL